VPGRDFSAIPKEGPHAREQLRALLAVIEAALGDGRPYLLGADASLADAACFQQVWFLRFAPQSGSLVDEFRRVCAWRDRVDALVATAPSATGSTFTCAGRPRDAE